MPLSETFVRLNLRESTRTPSWPEHERRTKLALRRLHVMLDGEADVGVDSSADARAGDGADAEQPSITRGRRTVAVMSNRSAEQKRDARDADKPSPGCRGAG